MKTQQEYDFSVLLSMPRSVPNVERGNFMVTMNLLDRGWDYQLAESAQRLSGTDDMFDQHKILFGSRRAALVPYVDPVVSLAHRILFLFYHMLFPSSQTCDLAVQLAQKVVFPRGSMVPLSAYIEVEGGQAIQVYRATLTITAQLRGLRWLMFHYRLTTYLAFTVLFWSCELLFMGVAWVFWSAVGGAQTSDPPGKDVHGEHGSIEAENEESDRPLHFPTYGRQPPLKHEPRVKREFSEEQATPEAPFVGGEADDEEDSEDEDENDQWKRDSGLGTSYSEAASENLRKRPSKNLRENR